MEALAQLIPLAVTLSMAGLLLAVALESSFADLLYLLRKPSLLLRSVLAMNVVMPLFAIAMGLVFVQDLQRPVLAALVAMALGPVPPILPGKGLKAGGPRRYTMGLVTVSAALSIVLVPVMVTFIGRLLGNPADVSMATMAGIVATWMLGPLALGAAVRAAWPGLAGRLSRPLQRTATLLLLLALVPVLIELGPRMLGLLGQFTLVAVIVFTLVGLGVGHLLGGPDPDQRTVLALSTCTRHPAVAMAILQADPDRSTELAAVMLILLVGTLVCIPYVRMRAAAGVPGRRLAK